MPSPTTWLNGDWRKSPYAKQESAGFGIDVDNLYGFQCVDFSIAYSVYLGHPLNGGHTTNAIDLWLKPQSGWAHQSSPRVGDVYIKPYSANGIEYGDTGVVKSVSGNTVVVLAQNQNPISLEHGSPPITVIYSLNEFEGFLRPEGSIVEDMEYAGHNAEFWFKENASATKIANTRLVQLQTAAETIKQLQSQASGTITKQMVIDYLTNNLK